ncbi:unnamed protein product [Rotaria sp. Silwood1]|nr:unnamed protein product [Rotaria sp. Silwood1]
MDDQGESAENVTTNKQDSSTTSTDSIETFQLDFYRVHVHFLFSEKEKKAIFERFNEAKQFLTNVISADPRCTRVWANIIADAYEKITVHSSTSQIIQLLFSTSTITTSRLQELIAIKIIIAIVHPDAAANPSVLDPVRTKEYATTTRFEDKALIAINLMKKAIFERFNEAKQFLTNVISADPRCTRVWANIIADAYEKITVHSSTSEITQLLFSTSTITISRLQELIATKIIITIVHPDAAANPSVLDPVRTKEYATTTRFEDKALIAINPMVFNNETTIHGSRISRESCTLFLAILLSHEITHAVKYIGEKQKTTPELSFFRTYSSPDEYDGGNALEHELFCGEMHINRDCTLRRLGLKRQRINDSRKTHYDYSESTDYENKKNDEEPVPLLRYHTRTSVFKETDNVNPNEYYQSLLKYHCEKDTSQAQSPDDPLLS